MRCVFTLNQNCLKEFINVISGNLLYLEFSSSYLSKTSFQTFYLFHCSIPSHFLSLSSLCVWCFCVLLCSVHRHPDFLTNCSQLNKQMSPLGLEPLVQQLWTCALWQRVELMPIMKWGFTAGIWQGLESLLLKQVEYC